jgi:hypothetical protein
MHSRPSTLATLAAIVSTLCACSSVSHSGSPCGDISIDRFKELTIVDDVVVTDTRAMNTSDGAWSFRNAIENMVPQGSDPGQFVLSWFNEWVTDAEVNGYAIPDGPQVSAGATQAQFAANMNLLIVCPWLQRSMPSNGCNTDCSICAVNPPKLDLTQAPFRLLAIVNRMDLGQQPGINPNGEGRLVFGLTSASADDPSSSGMSMTLIFEYHLPPPMTVTQWAQTWHELGSYTAFDEGYNSALQAVTDQFVLRSAMPEQPNGSALSQSRTNGNVLFWAWQMRQFQIGIDGEMHGASVRNTPDPSLNGSAVLTQFLQQNTFPVQNNDYLLPDNMLSGTVDELLYNWSFPGVDSATQLAFTKGTCNGCHASGANPPVDLAFHVSPLRQGPSYPSTGLAKLSPFVNNPMDPTQDDLARRTTILQNALCGQ